MKKRIAVFAAAALIISCTLSAADSLSLYKSFSDSLSEPKKAISYYDQMSAQIAKDRAKYQKSLEKAVSSRNAGKAGDAYAKLQELSRCSITPEQSDCLLSAIIEKGSDPEQLAWLYQNSAYYNPSLTLCSSVSGNGLRSSWRKTVKEVPGTSIELPSASSYGNGIFRGWGLTEDSVTYEAGSVIQMPATDQRLYAVFTPGVSFSDERTGFSSSVDIPEDGNAIAVPSVASDDSAVFAGWADKTGSFISPDETEYSVEGNGTEFHALWKDISIKDASARYYKLDAIPLNTQVELSLSAENTGTEDLRNVTFSVTSADEDLTVIGKNAWIPVFSSGSSVRLGGARLVAKTKGSYILNVEAYDSEGSKWSAEIPVKII